ncbi:transposase [Salmonella enterica]|uniref:Transposase n=1 Tax=Salmonella enterica TaxID=28901 RepID=A0A627B7L2_SALER|nr:hypothetical protein [Salmonella enterica]EDQ3374825.1 transposase [Salmonella enterica subsp. enterica serovar Oslo]EBT4676934.1 transposase [Salmonella enterica]EDB4078408.1 transposase [Salmonella enterica]EDB5428789.1 transposase [Salmonella enterica]
MIPLPSGTKIWLVAGITDMRNGFNGLATKVQTALKDDPISWYSAHTSFMCSLIPYISCKTTTAFSLFSINFSIVHP